MEKPMLIDTITIEQFVIAHGITMKSTRTNHNPNMQDSANMDHWRVELRKGRKQMTLVFSQGYGHKGMPPNVYGVLDCLASDAGTVQTASDFEEWCSELGYDPDSRKAEKTYKAVEHQASRLQRFLGDEAYDQLLFNTERN
jgi:hypothetical protein